MLARAAMADQSVWVRVRDDGRRCCWMLLGKATGWTMALNLDVRWVEVVCEYDVGFGGN
jgi:hypothetical protein